jgi:hypothetical protein
MKPQSGDGRLLFFVSVLPSHSVGYVALDGELTGTG